MKLALEEKVVVLTGGTGGIGKQICLDFLLEGAKVICLHRSQQKMNELREWLSSQVDLINLVGIESTMKTKTDIKTAIDQVVRDFGRLNILVNCAGVVEEIPFAMSDEAVIDKMIDQNLKLTMLVTQAALKPMFSQNSGSIVNISSVVSGKGGRGIVAYAAAKAGIEAFSRTLALEVGRKNIRINCVKPGVIQTQMSQPLQDRASEYVKQSTVLGRFGKPAEISKAVLFLSSEESASYITGTTLTVDGGVLL